LLQIAAGIISVIIYQPLKNAKIEACFALLGLSILELFMNLISVAFLNRGIFGLLLSLLISLYFLYEIKSNYARSVKVLSQKKPKTRTKKVKTTKK
jgi:hypothetical protein